MVLGQTKQGIFSLSLHANEDKLSKIQARNMSRNLSTKTPATQLTYN